MTFDYASSSIALVDLAAGVDPHGGYAMCELHAGRLTAPVGWRLYDGREIALTLFSFIEHVGHAPTDALRAASEVA